MNSQANSVRGIDKGRPLELILGQSEGGKILRQIQESCQENDDDNPNGGEKREEKGGRRERGRERETESQCVKKMREREEESMTNIIDGQ